jgi:hypothetical protein
MDKLFNALWFQFAWFICASSVQYKLEFEALSCCALFIFVHIMRCAQKRRELSICAAVLTVGILFDSALQSLGVIDFYGWHLSTLSPFWDWMIWLMFALTLESSLAFIKQMNWIAQAFTGLVFSPLSYVSGSKLGAAYFELSPGHVLFLGLSWMVLLPFIFWILERIKREFD